MSRLARWWRDLLTIRVIVEVKHERVKNEDDEADKAALVAMIRVIYRSVEISSDKMDEVLAKLVGPTKPSESGDA